MKVLTVFGMSPKTIKIASLVQALASDAQFEEKIFMTVQHHEMLDQVLELFKITPGYDLSLINGGQAIHEYTSRVLLELIPVVKQFKINVLMVYGDTATTFTTSLAVYFEQIEACDVEVSLRTSNIYSSWSEEVIRELVHLLTKYYFAPAEPSKQNLLKKIMQRKVYL